MLCNSVTGHHIFKQLQILTPRRRRTSLRLLRFDWLLRFGASLFHRVHPSLRKMNRLVRAKLNLRRPGRGRRALCVAPVVLGLNCERVEGDPDRFGRVGPSVAYLRPFCRCSRRWLVRHSTNRLQASIVDLALQPFHWRRCGICAQPCQSVHE